MKHTEERNLALSMALKVFANKLNSVCDTCINCEHFNEPKEQCKNFDNQRPPARVIAFGCPAFTDKVPF